jgi:hypothetical protein
MKLLMFMICMSACCDVLTLTIEPLNAANSVTVLEGNEICLPADNWFARFRFPVSHSILTRVSRALVDIADAIGNYGVDGEGPMFAEARKCRDEVQVEGICPISTVTALTANSSVALLREEVITQQATLTLQLEMFYNSMILFPATFQPSWNSLNDLMIEQSIPWPAGIDNSMTTPLTNVHTENKQVFPSISSAALTPLRFDSFIARTVPALDESKSNQKEVNAALELKFAGISRGLTTAISFLENLRRVVQQLHLQRYPDFFGTPSMWLK